MSFRIIKIRNFVLEQESTQQKTKALQSESINQQAIELQKKVAEFQKKGAVYKKLESIKN